MTDPLYILLPHHTGSVTAKLNNDAPVTIADYGVRQEAVELQAFGGRWNEFEDLEEVNDPRAVVRQQYDGTSTLDLSAVAINGSEVITGATSTGQQVTLTVGRQTSKHGWADATYFMPEVDANGDLIIEPGEHHRVLYITMAPGAWNKTTIAADAGVASGVVTGPWLLTQPKYGSTQANKVDAEVGRLIFEAHRTLAGLPNKVRTSIHVGLEAGYTNYPQSLSFIGFGQSALHPILVFSYGTGAAPFGFNFSGNGPTYHANFVFKGVDTGAAATVLSFENWMVADLKTTHEFGPNAVHMGAGHTFYRSSIVDATKPFPRDGQNNPSDSWGTGRNITAGTGGIKMAGTFYKDIMVDHNGWGNFHTEPVSGVDVKSGQTLTFGMPTGIWKDANGNVIGGQPKTIYSHNIYCQYDCADMTWDGVLSMRSASVAGQMRIGGWQMRGTAIDNQIGFQNHGVPYDEMPGERTFWSTNIQLVCTSGADVPYMPGFSGTARQWGFDFKGTYATDIDCLVMHRANPDDPVEKVRKDAEIPGVWKKAETAGVQYSNRFPPLFSNIVDFNWSAVGRGTSGLSDAFMKTITIQRRAAQLLGVPKASINDYANYCRGLSVRALQLEIRAVNKYLLSAREPTLEISLDDRTPTTAIFKPDWRTEGFRSDIPLNWSVKDWLMNGDSIDLFGNYVKWVQDSLSMNNLNVRTGGLLDVNSGKVSFETVTAGANVQTSNCGKLYVKGFDGKVTTRGDSRFAALTASAGSVEASGKSEMIFGPDWTVRSGEELRIVGDMGWIGWDSISATGKVTLKAGSKLVFEATPIVRYDRATTAEMKSEHWFTAWDARYAKEFRGQTSGATGFHDSTFRSNQQAFTRIRRMVGTPVVGELTIAPMLQTPATGKIGAILPATIGKIEAGWKGRLGTEQPAATFQVILEAGSFLEVKGRSYLATGQTYDLGGGTGTRVTFVDQGATKDAGFAVTSGKLTLAT